MKTLITRALVVTAIGSGAVYAGLTGLSHASAATNSPSASSTKARSTATASATNSDHNCPKDSSDSPSSNSS
jgi:hypothetical protein